MKNSLEDLNNRFHLDGERICKREGRSIMQSEEWGEKGKKNEKCGVSLSIPTYA